MIDHFTSDEVSIGRYVLAGGELAAMVVCDAVLRKLPGALGHEDSAHEESFSKALEGAPEYPHYTRPAEFRGWVVPEVLLSGHHARVREWRLEQSRARAIDRSASRVDLMIVLARGPLTGWFATIGRRPRGRGPCSYCAYAPSIGDPPVPSALALAMSTVIDSLERAQLRRVPAFDAGDRLRVHFQVIEGTRRRTQVFEGVVIKRQGHGARETFTVRKQSFGVGVERTFPLHSPKIERIEVAARGDVRRAKLYYLRGRVGKRARVRERRSNVPEEAIERELLYAPEAQDVADDPAESRHRPRPPTRAETETAGRGRGRRARGAGRRPRRRGAGRRARGARKTTPLPRSRPTRDRLSPRPAKNRCDQNEEVGRELGRWSS